MPTQSIEGPLHVEPAESTGEILRAAAGPVPALQRLPVPRLGERGQRGQAANSSGAKTTLAQVTCHLQLASRMASTSPVFRWSKTLVQSASKRQLPLGTWEREHQCLEDKGQTPDLLCIFINELGNDIKGS